MHPKDLPVSEETLASFRRIVNEPPTPILSQGADTVLALETQKAMSHRLGKARQEDRHSWWNPAVCSIAYLRNLLDKAIADEDWVSVINYAAMIRVREAADNNA